MYKKKQVLKYLESIQKDIFIWNNKTKALLVYFMNALKTSKRCFKSILSILWMFKNVLGKLKTSFVFYECLKDV